MSDVELSRGRIATVTIVRPEKRNALSIGTTQAIAESIHDAALESRVIILTGRGDAFSAGGDFEELVRFTAKDPEEAARGLYESFQLMIRTIREVDVPVIAAINGHAMGAGMDLALACDLRVCAADARLGQVWVRLGIIPGTGGAFWVSLLAGSARAAEMLLTGEPIDASTALAWGLVNEVVPKEALIQRAESLAEAIARNAPGAVAANKRALDNVIKDGWESALAHARQAQPARFASTEFAEALAERKKS